jgi:hypothetical protein
MSNPPVTLTEIAVNLSRMSRELAKDTFDLADLELKAVALKNEAAMVKEKLAVAYAIAYLKAGLADDGEKEPTVATREARAIVATQDLRQEHEIAQAKVRSAMARVQGVRDDIDSIKVRIDCARSSGTLLRAELEIDKVR